MRMLECQRTTNEWARFFGSAHDQGVRWLHCSDEYESFPLLCQCLAELRATRPGVTFRFVVKLANPGFDDSRFDESRFVARLSSYSEHLGTDHFDLVQWMWRTKDGGDAHRVSRFLAESARLDQSFSTSVARGLVGQVLCFPYSPTFAHAALTLPSINGLVIYRNVLETEYESALDDCMRLGKHALAIRPFAAGKALASAEATPETLLRYSFSHPAISGIIVGTSSLKHLSELLAASAQAE
ncbi:MAG: hypothetical protein H0W78_09025 [Planctomycetes bacterium]|nr:hypothetical protein [Planctomycetota bacterium]